jgi:prolyl-tRNA synthetase
MNSISKKSFEGSAAISPTRAEDFPSWYQGVVKAAELAENSPVRGCMVIKPWGYGIWELIQKELDSKIKDTGHENAYFPLFIPLTFLEQEAAHVEGFAKECAVVTHHRLEVVDGKLVPSGPLEEPLIVRPTSETIIGHSFANWIQSYRDLPLLINQWANVVRWEMRPRLWLRTAEFLWQEGHTAHSSAEEALEETLLMHSVYDDLITNTLAIPGFKGEKPSYDRFPGAERSFTVEAIMQDGKALQCVTSHYLGTNFSKAFSIKFSNQNGEIVHVHTTSWGATSRLVGGMIMVHGDDNGLRLPPRVAPSQVVIIPVIPKEELKSEVLEYCNKIAGELRKISWLDSSLRVKVDNRDLRGGEKSWSWIKKGAPLRLELGPKDAASQQISFFRRDKDPKDRNSLSINDFTSECSNILNDIQSNLLLQAQINREKLQNTDISSFDDFNSFFKDDDSKGFVIGGWSEDSSTVKALENLKVSVRCILGDAEVQKLSIRNSDKCIISGQKAKNLVVFAKSY